MEAVPRRRLDRVALALTIFLGAFLLFFVQPMIARRLLPEFGGAASVWLACLLFFQASLLLGYCYAHGLRIYSSPKRQILIHCGLVAAAIAWTGFSWGSLSLGMEWEIPLVRLMAQLIASIGLPFVLLAGTSPLVQHWYGLAHEQPYRLYALSNLGSLLALLAYPFLIVPYWGQTDQFHAWLVGLVLYLVLCLSNLRRYAAFSEREAAVRIFRASGRDRLYWTALSACGAMVLISSTCALTRAAGPMPFLWILPLSAYLITFILCFERQEWYWRKAYFPLFVASSTALMALNNAGLSFELSIALHTLVLFSTCMVCHGEMVRMKPESAQLTEFYLFLSLGGVAGAVFVNVIAPAVLDDYYEYPFAVLLSLLLASRAATASLPRFAKPLRALSLAFALVLGGLFVKTEELEDHVRVIAADRSFYGLLEVLEVGPNTRGAHHRIYSDDIEHGSQLTGEEFRHVPITYFSYQSGVGMALLNYQKPNRRVGIIGLGAGTLAAYGRPGDRFRFYEINPQSLEMANRYFTYLRDSKAEVEVILGDARLRLQGEVDSGRRFDILVLDAFNGDAVPAHLLTAEAWDLYWRLLDENGVLAINVSNNFLDLVPVIQHHNQRSGRRELVQVVTEGDDGWNINAASWLLESANRQFLSQIGHGAQTPSSEKRPVEWTDEKFSMLELLR